MKANFFGIMTFLLCAINSSAQDVNLSTINQTPVLLNPAQAGSYDNSQWRLSTAFRNVSFSGRYAFSSGAFSLEHRFKQGVNENDRLAIGFTGVFDQSNNGALRSNYVGVALAYGKALDAAGKSTLSAGLQGVWATRRLDVNKLQFEDQFTSGGFATSMPSVDAFRNGAINYLDVNAGIRYQLKQDHFGFDLGGAMFHGSKPQEQFWGSGYELPVRYTVHGGTYFNTNGNDRIYLQAVANFQDAAREQLVGGYFSKELEAAASGCKLNLGVYYRVQQAAIPFAGLECKQWKVSLAYDAPVNRLSQASNNLRALEMNLQLGF